MQDLNDMLYFAEVAERGGFAAAGRALGIPKSRLSRRVAELEAHLGVRLLQRTTRTLSLTEVGEAYLRHCLTMRESAQAAADAVAQVRSEPRGTVRVTCPVTLAQTVLAELMPQFLERHPLVRMEMQVTNRVVNVVEEGVDVALRVRATLDESGSMVVKRLGEGCQLLVASPAQIARQGMPGTLRDLARMDTLAMSASEGRASLRLIGPDGREETVQFTPRYVADDLLTLKHAALAGTGLCWLPDYLCLAELEAGQFVRVLPQWSQPKGIVHAVFASRRGLSPAVRGFLDFLGETMPGNMRAGVDR
ncbi:LysR family transcriptional regulator [Alicycliphilus denitrificans]|uniref:Transcriptional regulator, LysR family n=2 Tax=Alicycliphilus denitrificans TaxID=179636 RepID=F4GEV0_ALIDK|nr:LysR family transcriptional regulator [Alicycliphilus denitrificans]ADV00186.1 LysR substrate-binding protein [Alicycliphilus denitrificans BC]AEB84986.1 transcriptional regulator, LysR family [Alicycliphilus denitrificans K601]QKD44030.1 LysR family transcriptional regulator [Alicycliphilus denitrificans]GAO23108.1 LysR family transcriptional regulator [Alicycliphilus sp. B1]